MKIDVSAKKETNFSIQWKDGLEKEKSQRKNWNLWGTRQSLDQGSKTCEPRATFGPPGDDFINIFAPLFCSKNLTLFLTYGFWHTVHGIWQTAHKFGEFKVTNLANLAAQFGAKCWWNSKAIFCQTPLTGVFLLGEIDTRCFFYSNDLFATRSDLFNRPNIFVTTKTVLHFEQ
jgi:hypothetical protein